MGEVGSEPYTCPSGCHKKTVDLFCFLKQNLNLRFSRFVFFKLGDFLIRNKKLKHKPCGRV